MHEILVGLNVTDDVNYTKYREAMTPILEEMGGSFGYDFKIAEVLRSETASLINRVFTIRFPSEEVMGEFFSNEKYQTIKDEFFENSVESTTIISSYQRD